MTTDRRATAMTYHGLSPCSMRHEMTYSYDNMTLKL